MAVVFGAFADQALEGVVIQSFRGGVCGGGEAESQGGQGTEGCLFYPLHQPETFLFCPCYSIVRQGAAMCLVERCAIGRFVRTGRRVCYAVRLFVRTLSAKGMPYG